MSQSPFSFLTGANADFIAELYERYLANPSSVDPSWANFFGELKDDGARIKQELRGASWSPKPAQKIIGTKEPANDTGTKNKKAPMAPAASSADAESIARKSVRALMMIRAYRSVGHMMADTDPLGIKPNGMMPECDPAFWGFTEADMDSPVFIDGVLGLESATPREIVGILQNTYCRTVGYEFLHVAGHDQKQWLQERIESAVAPTANAEKRVILDQLTRAESFEKFLATKFPGTKRFGLEGGESTIPSILAILDEGAKDGLEEAVFGMAHRGRLNVLTNILGKSFTALFAEFQGMAAYPDSVQGSGDVKYHMGTNCDRDFEGKSLHLTLNANPSHLEFVNPVVLGRVRAKLQQRTGKVHLGPEDYKRVVGVLIHGDAAFAGQGIVAESMMMSQLVGYRTGGTVHIVINNQIGFTTSPQYAKSSTYCSDIAKMIAAPIFHVNGDDPEAVARISRLAMQFRQTFKQDVVIDIVCYRRHGHNEGDEPAFTQPQMYKNIRARATTREVYAKQLVNEGSLTQAETDAVQNDFVARLEKDFSAATSYKPNKADWLEGKWQGMSVATGDDRSGDTGVPVETLKEIGRKITEVPPGFDVNPKIAKQLKDKLEMVETGHGFDWATAEALAVGSLLIEGTAARLSGQDVGRGTFSQRHAVLYDQTNETKLVPLNHVRENKQAVFDIYESPLSEMAVLGFEYGFSLAEPNELIMWEAQFGDFANGAQVIIDQFIASAETKWLRMSGLTLLLPHGYEGQGPEHSSARLERFLQGCAEDNWQVVYCSTPANYFHALRRQMRRSFRKPLVMMTPKSMLRNKLCVSSLADMAAGSKFLRVIGETSPEISDDRKVRRVLICTGKVYYDLLAEREARGIRDVAIVRVEELYPFPQKQLADQLRRYPKADVAWVQEEPRNMGAWTYIDRRIEGALGEAGHKAPWPVYIGRPDGAAPATGSLKRHNKEQAEIVEKALGKS